MYNRIYLFSQYLILLFPLLSEGGICTTKQPSEPYEYGTEEVLLINMSIGTTNVTSQTIHTIILPSSSSNVVSFYSTTQTELAVVSETITASISESVETSSRVSSKIIESPTPAWPEVTNQAYIDTIIRHHNIHRFNHSGRGQAAKHSPV